MNDYFKCLTLLLVEAYLSEGELYHLTEMLAWENNM